jgi:hypothetical protein
MPQKGIKGNEIFIFRLNWSILEDPCNAELLSIDVKDKPQWTSLFSDPVAEEAATNPPVSRLEISIHPLSAWEHWQQADEEPPADGLVENTDGRPISVKQLMEAVHDYAVPLRRLLCQSCDVWSKNEARAKFYLTYLVVYRSSPEDETPSATIDVIEETGKQGQDILVDRLQETKSRYRGRLASK